MTHFLKCIVKSGQVTDESSCSAKRQKCNRGQYFPFACTIDCWANAWPFKGTDSRRSVSPQKLCTLKKVRFYLCDEEGVELIELVIERSRHMNAAVCSKRFRFHRYNLNFANLIKEWANNSVLG